MVGVIYRDFNLFHWSLLKQFFLFIWLLFAPRPSLQCLISAPTQAGGGGLLFSFDCSVALRGGRGAQIDIAGVCVGSTHSVPATLGLPPLTGVCSPRLHCSGSWLLYMERALRCVRLQFSGIPQKRRLGWACVLCFPQP